MPKRSKKLEEADTFRSHVERLRRLRDAGWRDWEADWLDDEANRADDYIYSENERVILNQLIASATLFESYNEWSIYDLIKIAYNYRADLDEDSADFIEILWREQPKALRARQINRLARLASLSEAIGWDEQVQSVLRQTRERDGSLRDELPAWVPYA